LLANPGFETPFRKGEWNYVPGTVGQGALIRSTEWAHLGHFSLKLTPNQHNTVNWLPSDFAVTQEISTSAYRGKQLYFGGWMRALPGATAFIRILIVQKNGNIIFRELTQDSSSASYFRDIMDVPDADLTSVTLMCAVKGTAGAGYFDEVIVSPTLASTVQTGQYDPGPPLSATVTVNAANIVRTIPSTLYGMNLEWNYNGHSLWNPYNERLDDRLLNLTSDLGVGGWRYPGGVFANYYHWQNGIGPHDSRPVVRIEPDDPGFSANGFGTDEALALAAATGVTNLMFTANVNTGTPREAADWVRYVNKGTQKVKYWEIGNELYLHIVDANGEDYNWTPEQYSDVFTDFATAMREADPNIKLGADVEFYYPFKGCARMGKTGCWTDVILMNVGSQVDFVSVHSGFAPLGLAPISGLDAGWDVRTVYSAMLAYPVLYGELLEGLGRKIDQLTGDRAPLIRIAATEWGPLFGVGSYSRLVDHVKTMGAALFASSTFNVLLRNPRVETATAFKLVDEAVYGWIGPRQGLYVIKAPYYVFQLYARHFLPNLVQTVVTSSPTYDSRTVLGVPAIKAVPYLDAVASIGGDGSSMSIIVTNKHFDRAIQATLNLQGFSASGKGTAWTMNGMALDANTGTDLPPDFAPQSEVSPDGRFHQGGPGEVWVNSTDLNVSGNSIVYEFPAHSITALVLNADTPRQ
ncbi:MAG: hypothetical protein M3Z36_03040, partial [Acidobacteriota bacterium]|nr:hypothetical protein [Acidobacteriota bacterium]